ncbi:MAG: hypothetical protein LM517_10405 [Nitrosomonas sp.]|nr:hypothetical protein [Nitrosomonas sp.]
MKMSNRFNIVLLLTAIGLTAMYQSVSAHTRLKTPVISENNATHGSDYNAVVVAHGCIDAATNAATIDTLGTVVVFPDGKDSTITVNGQPYSGTLADYVTNWGSPVTKVQDKSIFPYEDYIKDSLGNKLGFWTGGGKGLKAGFRAVVPIATAGVIINPESCAKSVQFVVSIADICQITDAAGFSDQSVMLWTPTVGSIYQFEGAHTTDSPATLTVNRSITPLPASCGAGEEVVVKPSANQLNRDMRIIYEGQQIWPKQ